MHVHAVDTRLSVRFPSTKDLGTRLTLALLNPLMQTPAYYMILGYYMYIILCTHCSGGLCVYVNILIVLLKSNVKPSRLFITTMWRINVHRDQFTMSIIQTITWPTVTAMTVTIINFTHNICKFKSHFWLQNWPDRSVNELACLPVGQWWQIYQLSPRVFSPRSCRREIVSV